MPLRGFPVPRSLFAAALAVLFAGCGIDRAPADLDGAVRWLWLNYDSASDADLADAVVKAHAAAGAATMSKALTATTARLQPHDADGVAMVVKGDVSRARGMLVVDVVRCTLPKFEALFIAKDQKAVHPSYDSYSRDFLTDAAAYFARRVPELRWTTGYSVSGLGVAYSVTGFLGGVRFVAQSPLGPIVAYRGFLPSPANFNNDSDFLRQDYQVSAFYERSPGEVIRISAMWREMRFAGFDSEGDILPATTTSGLVSEDKKVAAKCLAP